MHTKSTFVFRGRCFRDFLLAIYEPLRARLRKYSWTVVSVVSSG